MLIDNRIQRLCWKWGYPSHRSFLLSFYPLINWMVESLVRRNCWVIGVHYCGSKAVQICGKGWHHGGKLSIHLIYVHFYSSGQLPPSSLPPSLQPRHLHPPLRMVLLQRHLHPSWFHIRLIGWLRLIDWLIDWLIVLRECWSYGDSCHRSCQHHAWCWLSRIHRLDFHLFQTFLTSHFGGWNQGLWSISSSWKSTTLMLPTTFCSVFILSFIFIHQLLPFKQEGWWLSQLPVLLLILGLLLWLGECLHVKFE